MQTVYSRFYMMNRRDLFRAQNCIYKQVVMKDGDKADTNLYIVREGQILLKRRIELDKGATKLVPFATLGVGQTFNEQAVYALYNNQQADENKGHMRSTQEMFNQAC